MNFVQMTRVPDPDLCPSHIKDALNKYFLNRMPPESFLKAVLENDLLEAVLRADDISRAFFFDIVAYIYNECPSRSYHSWGSPEAAQEWLNYKT